MKTIWLGMKVIVGDVKEVGAIFDEQKNVTLPLIAVNEAQRADIAEYIKILAKEEGGVYTVDRFVFEKEEMSYNGKIDNLIEEVLDDQQDN